MLSRVCAAPVGVFSRGTTRISGSLSCGAREVRSPCAHFSRVRLCVTPQTAPHQAPPSLGFSRHGHWSGLPFPSPMHESEDVLGAGQAGGAHGHAPSTVQGRPHPSQTPAAQSALLSCDVTLLARLGLHPGGCMTRKQPSPTGRGRCTQTTCPWHPSHQGPRWGWAWETHSARFSGTQSGARKLAVAPLRTQNSLSPKGLQVQK